MKLSVQIRMIRHPGRWMLVLLALAGSTLVQAATIHKWVDDKGVTHYSDEPPEHAPAPVTQIDIETGTRTPKAEAGDDADHYYSIANQWQRMQRESELRQQRELERASLKQKQQAAAAPPYREVRETRYVAAYPYRYHRRHRKGPYPPITPYRQQVSPGGQISSGFPTN